MQVLVVSGFLGSGKTTLIQHLLHSGMEGLGKLAVIVNEVGKVGIDGTLLSAKGVDMIELTSGCICCTLRIDFSKALKEIRAVANPDFLVVEATGVAQPADILDILNDPDLEDFIQLKGLVTVVNADMFEAREILGPFYDNQIRSADVLLLNKVDLVSPEECLAIEKTLKLMNPGARVYRTKFCKIDPAKLLLDPGTEHSTASHGHHLHGHREEGGFQTFSFQEARAFDRQKLEDFLSQVPPNIFRIKGWVRFKDSSAYLDLSGKHYRIAPVGDNRNTTLAFVGKDCNEQEILRSLQACLI